MNDYIRGFILYTCLVLAGMFLTIMYKHLMITYIYLITSMTIMSIRESNLIYKYRIKLIDLKYATHKTLDKAKK